jgi:predicted site-specific integrase-resolvase
MPIKVDGKTYYQTSEAARMAGISRSTLLRWLDQGIINESNLRDRRGWRIFAQEEIKTIIEEAQKSLPM